MDKVYSLLQTTSQDLMPASAVPPADGRLGDRWSDVGEWTTLASRIGAESVLFVQNDPVFVFSALTGEIDDQAVYDAYRRAWCMSGPFCLFLALADGLRVYALTEPPEYSAAAALSPLETFTRIEDIEKALGDKTIADLINQFTPEGGSPSLFGRADFRLVNDLKAVRRSLMSSGMAASQAHSLIGRSILIRYLEDRQVIGLEYFRQVAGDNPRWSEILSAPPEKPVIAHKVRDRLFDRVLLDKEFSTALFERLSNDFNGDLFSIGDGATSFKAEHLLEMRNLLLGATEKDQPELFFWAYDFEVVPLSLISSIYEEFYHAVETNGDTAAVRDDNTHFTPISLVQDVLNRMLPREVLERRPRVLDPSCGSGIFLVEAFKRMVRFETLQKRRKLASAELRAILRTQVCGIELKEEAARVAAFSLYLALLDSMDPSDILAAGKMPHLIHCGSRDEGHYGTVIVANAFALTPAECEVLAERNRKLPKYKGRVEVLELLGHSKLDLELGTFDVVVGNPPWQEAVDYEMGTNGRRVPIKKGGPARQALLWARHFAHAVGDKSYSQLFLQRALSFSGDAGACGLLISTKVIWNGRDSSRDFRTRFLAEVLVKEVVNYTHVRRLFFASATAPFMFMHYMARGERQTSGVVSYCNARRTRLAETTRIVAFTGMERRIVKQSDLEAFDYLWKTYWWGGHRDAALVARLHMERTLGEFLDGADCAPGYGWQKGNEAPKGDLARLPELDASDLEQYGKLNPDWLGSPPTGVKRQPDERLYNGQRLITKRGVSEPYGPICRVETEPFSFRHTVYCVPLQTWRQRDAEILLGIIWSSLARYRLFMTSGAWGGWYDQVTSEDILSTPVRIDAAWGMPEAEFESAADRIVDSVKRLQSSSTQVNWGETDAEAKGRLAKEREQIQQELDQAVFDLFEFSVPERELVNDFWEFEHRFYWKGALSSALLPLERPPVTSGVFPSPAVTSPEFSAYLAAMIEGVSQRLNRSIECSWEIFGSKDFGLVAVRFDVGSRLQQGARGTERDAWENVLDRFAEREALPLKQSLSAGKPIHLSDDRGFTIVKANRRRNWSATAAREDAEAVNLHFLRAGKKPE
ncbi:Eco57I restriction-modification methylase domain-containing protein [Mesorhizobium waimense]|uniref:Eco57I restriction-modification methylase domain-containing protein n=1 Tax=Mesorhizobium waimense TaxID=1300307 RepID=UPI00142E4CEE|nr:DNA methyltransferase [Mesorhizobium waimense]